MSALTDIEAALKAQLATPEGRATVENIEGAILEAACSLFNSILPSFVRTLAGGLIEKLESEGIAKVKSLTDAELLALGGGSITITEVATPNTDAIHTKEQALEALHKAGQ